MSIPKTSITVSIGDTRLPSLKSLRLEQGIGCHHRFDLCIDLEAGSNRYVHNIGSSSEWLGQPITVHSSDQPIFLGVVTNVRLHREGSDFGFILISGYSATYRMETAPGCFSWLEQPIGDAGKSGDVSSNRGFVFIPEVGDQVLLGFRHGDPGRPYVMGSLFNGSTGGGGGQGNKCKSLTTRSGSSLKLDDSDGSVTLHDKGGVSMNFDGAGNATTNTQSSNFVNAGSNNVINVGDGSSVISSDSDGNIILKCNNAITLVVGENNIRVCTEGIFINGKQQVAIGTDEMMTLKSKQDMTISSKTNMGISGTSTATLGSKKVSITGGNKVIVDGPDVNINS